jgi:hypothetical protein
LTDRTIVEKKLSRRQFMGTAAAGAAALGVAAGAASLMPKVEVATVRDKEAKAKPEATVSRPVTLIPTTWDYSADVVVIGYGGAGVAASIGAYDAGASVLILEKAPQALAGGNTGVSGGICTTPTPLTDFITIANMMCWNEVPLDVITATCTQITNLPNWVSSLGFSMTSGNFAWNLPLSFYQNAVSPAFCPNSPPGQVPANYIVVPPFNYPLKGTSKTGSQGGGKDFFAVLDNCRASRNIPVMFQTPATSLIQNPNTNEIVGVVATTWTGQSINVKANKAVILACGGYENNEEIKHNYAPESPKNEYITFYGTPYNTGDGIYMAQSVGAKLWHMAKKEVHALANGPASKEIGDGLVVDSLGYGFASATSLPGILVNRNGSRFINEYFDSGHNDNTRAWDAFVELWQTPDGSYYCDWPNQPFYAVFDSVAMSAGPLVSSGGPNGSRYGPVHNLYNWSQDNSVELAKGWIVGPATTPQALGAMITCRDFFGNVVGMSASGLASQVTAYNNMCTAGVDTQFGRAKATLLPLQKPPFYAMQLIECQTNTDGGPAHDAEVRTLDVNNNPIPRLYSPGELGSMWGGLYYGGGNVPEAIAMGRLAGANAAALTPWVA